MATNKNINECGWFYHAPAKRNTKTTEPVDTPYISQIPGLSEIPQEEFTTDPHKIYFKDTDTKFVRMAKQGGRKDLLVFREPSSPSKEAKGYPRVDWFYLQDNAIEDAENEGEKKPWEFLLPEYMVHDSYTPSFADGAPVGSYGPGETGRVPYACDKYSVLQSEGRDATDKRVRLPEARPPGYGVRNSKPVKVRSQAGKPTATVSHQDHINTSVTKGDRHGQMNKILSYDYERQWHEQMNRQNAKSPPAKPKGEPPIPSEYDDKYGKAVTTKKTTKSSPSPTSRRATNANKSTINNTQVDGDKSPFKLTRFKNVEARVDSHQPIIGKPVSVVN